MGDVFVSAQQTNIFSAQKSSEVSSGKFCRIDSNRRRIDAQQMETGFRPVGLATQPLDQNQLVFVSILWSFETEATGERRERPAVPTAASRRQSLTVCAQEGRNFKILSAEFYQYQISIS